VFAVLSDGWTYSDWVVGTTHIRDVDATWPQVGAELHHKAGPWPLSLQDTSTVLWPLGEAVVDIQLEAVAGGATRVTMHEQFEQGPLVAARNKINDLLLHQRNVEALRRLGDIAERRVSRTQPGFPR
jgi:hypothetical protein